MRPPLFVRSLSDAERDRLRAGLRSPDAFTLRRCQILLTSADGLKPSRIAAALGCACQTVRNTLRAFQDEGLACLKAKPKAPKTTYPVWLPGHDDDLKVLLHQSPRTHGQPTSLWTLGRVAQVCRDKGWTRRVLSGEAIRLAVQRLGVSWKRAKHWITSPDPEYARKKNAATG